MPSPPARATAALAAALLAAAIAAPRPARADDADAKGAPVAHRFVKHLSEAELDAAHAMMDPTMKSAMPPVKAKAMMGQLVQRFGKLESIGEAWFEDRIATHRRYRVPAKFAKQELDFRVVLDPKAEVSGLFVVPHVAPPAPAPEPEAPGREVEVTIGEGALALPGTITLPEGEGPFPGVVLVHGSGPNDRDESLYRNKPFRDLAWGLAKRGVAVLRYDKRTFVAQSSDAVRAQLEKVGDTLTVEHEVVADARAALAVLLARPEVDRVFVLGHSLGAGCAPRIADADPKPAGVIALAGATRPLHEIIVAQHEYFAGLDGVVTPEETQKLDAVRAEMKRIGDALAGAAEPPAGSIQGAPFSYWKDLAEHDAPATAARLGLPILVLQGARDYQVTLEDDFPGWKKALEGKPFATLKAYDGLDHLFREVPGAGLTQPTDYETPRPVAEAVIEDIAAFVKKTK